MVRFPLYLVGLLAQALAIQILLQLSSDYAFPTVSRDFLIRYPLGWRAVLVVLFAYGEELLFRAVPLRLLAFRCVPARAKIPYIVSSALLFGVYHLLGGEGGGGVVQCVHAIAAGVWLALFHFRYQRILVTGALHAAHNAILLLFAP